MATNTTKMMINCLIILWSFAFHLTHSGRVTGSNADAILSLHNEARAEVRNGKAMGSRGLLPRPKRMPDLRWSSNVAGMASEYAATCGRHKPTNGYMCTHSSGWNGITAVKRKYGVTSAGENIGCPGWGNKATLPAFAYKAWTKQFIAEKKDYYHGEGFTMKNGHYWQVITASVTEIGCGTAKCNDGWWMVCYYSPSYKASNGDPYEKASGGSSGGSSYNGGGGSSYNGGSSGSSSSGSSICINYLQYGLNGAWKHRGSHNGKPYYQKSGYYYFATSYGNYAINRQLQDASNWATYGFCTDYAIGAKCSGKYLINGATDTNAQFTSCNAFTSDDLPCTKHHANTLHFYETADKDPSDAVTFTMDTDEGCLNEEPVYKYMGDEVQVILYSDEDGYKWRMDSIYNVSGFQMVQKTLVCGEDDLYDCISGKWSLRSSHSIESGVPRSETVNGSVVTIGSASQNVFTYDPMVYEMAQIKAVSTKASPDYDTVIVPVVIVVAVLLIVGGVLGAFLCYRSKYKNVMKQMEVVKDEEEEDEEEVEAEAETITVTN